MNQFQQSIVVLLHGNLDLAGLKGQAITAAKRDNIVENGGQKAIDAAAKLVEMGVTAQWLCPKGRLAVDSLTAVESLISQGADVSKLQQFSPSQILAGLNESELAAVMPSIEAPVAETVVVAPVVETKPAAPKAEVKVEMGTCSYSCKKYPISELVVPNGEILRSMLKLPEGTLLTREQILKAAKHPRFVSQAQEKNHFWLTKALELHAQALVDAAKQAEKDAKTQAELEAYYAFTRDLKVGEVKEWRGKGRQRCICCDKQKVHLASDMLYPPLDVIKTETPKKDKDGNVMCFKDGSPILMTPTAEAVMRRFATCPKCRETFDGIKADEWMSAETMMHVIEQELATERATQEANQRDWERRNKQRQQGNRGGSNRQFDMSTPDDPTARSLLKDGVYTDDRPSNGKRNGGSRNDQNRRNRDDHGSHSELAESFVGG